MNRQSIISLLLCVLFFLSLAAGCTDTGTNAVGGEHPQQADISGALAGSADRLTIEKAPVRESVAVQTIVPVAGQPTVTQVFETKFERKTYTVEVEVNGSVYAGARSVDKGLPAGAGWNDPTVMTAYYRRFIDDPAMTIFFDDMARGLRAVKAREGLNDGEYLEFLITFVQQIPYDPNAPAHPRYPVEVVRDRTGDCDEKSLLLLGLLAHEGYDTAFILFPDEHHAAAGIRISTGGTPSFRVFEGPETGKYFYIESTEPTYIGLYTEPFGSAEAVVVPIGDGTGRFNRVNYISRITGTYQKIEERLPFMHDRMEEWEDEIREMERKLTGGTYESRAEWDRDHQAYLKLIDEHNDYVEKYNTYLEVYHYIAEHPYDIEGVYRHIDNSGVEDIRI
ncbi:hypothetical protein E2N92_02195 [Methanofollis formosanus]|uniref:Transglutaminase-like domain-containing protein n=1 Tax=Methanofollis formosanus TaxID=299308 RepID=A0A8G1A0S8_9EURY|nr:hypothetical protein [Methanofollis formosanus]QYZ78326.1 hypothetical protein E2N92_02195 [Methanofollis formosanus]